MNLNKKPEIIEGGIARDERGQLTFANNFGMSDVKRFYMVENSSLDVVRAWHGHAKEAKYVFVVSGSAIVAAVHLDDLKQPNKENEIHKYVISAKEPKIFYIPGGYANGFRSLEPDTKVIFFSTSTLEESKNDDFRFPIDYWGKEVWENN
ncbi:dTDP-4-dehydrorhamnose 3,5-epimerase family protein [Candidatus Nomurabacteria bacterium]|nr:dTDP-4-dehydrorhamnose 3,5-epimerase family protein [Candidatus Nomurabacteria bacterium]